MTSNGKKPEYQNDYLSIGNYLGLGLQLAVTVGVMVFIGYWLDKKFETSPWFIIILSILGISSALYNFLKTVLNSSDK